MKCIESVVSVPENGVRVIREGRLTRIFFDFREIPGDPEAEPQVNALECECVDVEEADYGKVVAAIVNGRYSADDVQALLANRTEALDPDSALEKEKRDEYLREYRQFQAWRIHAKEVANQFVIHNS